MGSIIKAIIFDCYGVLTTDKWNRFHSSISSKTISKQASLLNDQYDQGVINKQQFYSELSKITSKTTVELENLIGGSNYKNDELINYIKSLKNNYKIGLLSNAATNWVKDSFLTTDEKRLFDCIILSHEVGLIKPDPKIFELSCQQLGVKFNEVIFVDDNDYYCVQAQKLGIKSIEYLNNTSLIKELNNISLNSNN